MTITEQPNVQLDAETDRERRHQAIAHAVEIFGRGEFLLVSDDEDRENEGDLVIAADHVTPEALNFMITHGRGLVCVAVSDDIAARKRLSPMVESNGDHLGTAFTVSVDGSPAHGITTGISAGERAKTVQLLIDEETGPEDLCAPGHMFPLVARPGGLLERQGHTEAGVELARLAGCATPAAVIVEVIRDDGEMARRDDLEIFASQFGITYITIADLLTYVEDGLGEALPAQARAAATAG